MISAYKSVSFWLVTLSFLLVAVVVIQGMSVERCAVVGVGVLGTSLCRQILSEFPKAQVTGITKTTANHESIQKQVNSDRLHLVTLDQTLDHEPKFENVVFCAPPSGSEDYPVAVQEAITKYWAGPETGVFVFTSSGAVYGPSDGGIVTESSPLADVNSSPRVARLVNAEKAVLEAGGCCLRLAGLYNLDRGAHNYWITAGKKIDSAADGIINLLNYDDAASACLAAIKAGPAVCKGRAFLISDGNPMSRYGICESALKAKIYNAYKMPEFNEKGNEQPWALGKIYDGSMSNAALQWIPKYKSFDEFMESNS